MLTAASLCAMITFATHLLFSARSNLYAIAQPITVDHWFSVMPNISWTQKVANYWTAVAVTEPVNARLGFPWRRGGSSRFEREGPKGATAGVLVICLHCSNVNFISKVRGQTTFWPPGTWFWPRWHPPGSAHAVACRLREHHPAQCPK